FASEANHFWNCAIPKMVCFAGEVGLNGEIRPVTRMDSRIQEAVKLGFHEIYVSRFSKGLETNIPGIHIRQVGKVEEFFNQLFG
ncbi:MAG: hypothetical protein ACKOZY_00090, partial [Flavobacteriales bacterium]